MPITFSDLDDDTPIDDRWTVTKLMAAGYEEEWTRDCRTCGDAITAYRHRTSQRLLILNDPVLDPHHCEGP